MFRFYKCIKMMVGSQNVFLGYSALQSNTTGSQNISIGQDALYKSFSTTYGTSGSGSALSTSSGNYSLSYSNNTSNDIYCITLLDEDEVQDRLSKKGIVVVGELDPEDCVVGDKIYCLELDQEYQSIEDAKHDLLAFKLAGIK